MVHCVIPYFPHLHVRLGIVLVYQYDPIEHVRVNTSVC